MNSHLTSPRPNARVRRGSKRSNMGQIQVCNFNYYQNNLTDIILLYLILDVYCLFLFPTLFQVIFGPMFSGKSTELIRRLQRFKIARYNCLIVKYANDKRYTEDDAIATHDRQMLQAVNATKLNDLKSKFNIVDDYDVIGIDEGQFFPDIIEFAESMANNGKTVIVAALDGTYQRKGFANILELVPLAEHVIKLTAVCMNCFEDGSYTKRITEDKEVSHVSI